MQLAIYDEDLLRAPQPGDADLVDVPARLIGWPVEYLRWDGNELHALQQIEEREFYIDRDGKLRLGEAADRQPLLCAGRDTLIRIGGVWQHQDGAEAVSALRLDLVKAECRRRIYEVASAETQMNISMAAAVISARPDRSAEDLEIIEGAALAMSWVSAMRSNVETLTADSQADLAADANWPGCPAEVVSLASRF